VKISQEIIKESRVPLRSSIFSKKKFNHHQLISLIILKEEIGMNYRDFCDILEILTPVRELLNLQEIPHFTTLHKFFTRFSTRIFTKILTKTIRKLLQKGEKVAITSIDATGFTSDYASHYYSKRIGKTRKSFVKTSIAVDSNNLLVLGWKFSKSPVNDRKHAKSLINQTQRVTKSQCFTMDKGYDAEWLHEYIREYIGVDSQIPVRKWDGMIHSGKYRFEMLDNLDQEKYGQRNLVECVFSMIKRKYGDTLRSRRYYNQLKEIKIRIILHNMLLEKRD
jgi:transposase